MTLIPQPRAILFDWDNTLADSWPVIYKALRETFIAMGMDPWSFEDIKNGRDGIHHSLRSSFPRIFGDRWEDAKDIYYSHFLECHLEEIDLLPGVDEVLERLSPTTTFTAIVSNKTGPYLRDEVTHLGWLHHFDKVVGATDADKDKPDPDPIYFALEGTGIEPGEDVWMIGDSETDLECAINAGCRPIFFGDGDFHERFLSLHPNITRLKNHQELLRMLDEYHWETKYDTRAS